MKVILDVNILLSSLIRNSKTREIILKSGLDFYFPEDSLHKLRKYQDYILKKSGMNLEEYTQVMAILFKYVKIIPSEEINKHLKEARNIMEKIDAEDVVFIAAALSFNSAWIWSNDKHFDRQIIITVMNTQAIIKLLM